MKIVVGSNNPVKISAVKEVVEQIYSSVDVIGIGVDSGIDAQPFGEDITIKGAKQRAKRAIESVHDADLGVGLEGGIVDKNGRLFTTAWCIIVDRKGNEGIGGNLTMELPPMFKDSINKGLELGDIIDNISGMKETKKNVGAIGILTHNLTTRKSAYKILVAFALVRFINVGLYDSLV